jgi:hypothetical protein
MGIRAMYASDYCSFMVIEDISHFATSLYFSNSNYQCGNYKIFTELKHHAQTAFPTMSPYSQLSPTCL